MTATLESVGDEELVDFCRTQTSIPSLDVTSCSAYRAQLEDLFHEYISTQVIDRQAEIQNTVRQLLGAVPGF